MIMLLPSLLVWLYVAGSLLRLLPFHLPVKAALGALLLLACLKFTLYEWLGGSFFAPDLPRAALCAMEALYAAMILLAVLLLARDLFSLALWCTRRFWGTGWTLSPHPAWQGLGLLALAITLGGWSTWQAARVPDVRTVEIALRGLPERLNGFTVVQLSDLHILKLLDKNWLRAVVDKTNALRPDVVALTGDFNDGPAKTLQDAVSPLGELRATHGVYGVTGNHEYYFGAKSWTRLLENLGVRMLHNEHAVLSVRGEQLVIVGVPDPAEKRFGGEGPDVPKAFAGAPQGVVRILLAHQPSGAFTQPETNLQLSGHTHGGSLFFLKPLLAFYNNGFVGGLYTRGNNLLYVSPGTGIWGGFANRLGVPSEITRLVLRAK